MTDATNEYSGNRAAVDGLPFVFAKDAPAAGRPTRAIGRA